MANALATLPEGFGPLPSVFKNTEAVNDELGTGVSSSYAVIGYRGKVWSIKYQGEELHLMRDDGDGPRNSIEVVLLKASPAISKIFYKNGYVEGSNASPDCWSGNGVTPDPSVQNKVHPTCADCPMNAWGSRVTDAGKQGKSCADSRRVAAVPIADIANDKFGGPMLLRIPAASLKDLKGYGDLLQGFSFPYYAVATRISFDPQEAFPKFTFNAIRPLTEEEAKLVLELRDDKRVSVVVSETVDTVAAAAAAEAAKADVPKSPFENMGTSEGNTTEEPPMKPLSEQAKATAPRQEAKPEPKVEAKPEPKVETKADTSAADAAAQKRKEIIERALKARREAEALEAELAAATAGDSETVDAGAAGDATGDAGDEGEGDTGGAPESFDDMLNGLLKG